MKKFFLTLATVLSCAMTMTVFTACSSDDDDNPVTTLPGGDSEIVGNWCSDVSGKTYAKWNYGETWQNTEFKADGTGSTRIYYTYEGEAIGIEKIDFTYTASADGVLTMTPSDREAMTAKWKVEGDKLSLGNDDDINLSFTNTSDDMIAKFDKWNQTENFIEVPQPAKYTVFVYGNAGGHMDEIIEYGFWERTKEFLKDHNNVRVVKACKKHGLKYGFYYSHWQDWEDPDGAMPFWYPWRPDEDFEKYWQRKALPQVKELIEKYDPDLLWFDTWGWDNHITPERRDELIRLVRTYSDKCLINGRICFSNPGENIDFLEMHDNSYPKEMLDKPWQTPATMQNSWAYHSKDYNWKPATRMLRYLVSNTSMGGNYLLNV